MFTYPTSILNLPTVFQHMKLRTQISFCVQEVAMAENVWQKPCVSSDKSLGFAPFLNFIFNLKMFFILLLGIFQMEG